MRPGNLSGHQGYTPKNLGFFPGIEFIFGRKKYKEREEEKEEKEKEEQAAKRGHQLATERKAKRQKKMRMDDMFAKLETGGPSARAAEVARTVPQPPPPPPPPPKKQGFFKRMFSFFF